MKLYYSPLMASLSVMILAHELGLTLELEHVDPSDWTMADGRPLSDVSAKRCIPVLERDDGSILTETPIILNWLAARDADHSFTAPPNSEEHLRITEWMAYIASEQHKLFSIIDWDFDERAKAEIRDRLIRKFEIAEKGLDHAAYLVSDRYTIADIYLFIIILGLGFLEDFNLPECYPNLAAFRDRIAARPAVIAAMIAHGAIDAGDQPGR